MKGPDSGAWGPPSFMPVRIGASKEGSPHYMERVGSRPHMYRLPQRGPHLQARQGGGQGGSGDGPAGQGALGRNGCAGADGARISLHSGI